MSCQERAKKVEGEALQGWGREEGKGGRRSCREEQERLQDG